VKELKGNFILSTDLADWLVLKGIPFREAHNIVGKIVNQLEKKVENFEDLTIEKLKTINPIFDETALNCLNLSSALSRKKTFGSPNPKFVKEQIKNWKEKLKSDK
jgi:argininosuccinate lyase